jgi:hypothetical protein
MENKEAIEAIRSNWPDERYSILREALTKAIAALECGTQPTSTNTASHEIAAFRAAFDLLRSDGTEQVSCDWVDTWLRQLQA